jgi:ankyrin repeat protein
VPALHDAAKRADIAEVRRLLEAGTSANQLDDSDETALHRAAAFGQEDVVRLLLDRGAEVDQTDGNEFRTALIPGPQGRSQCG